MDQQFLKITYHSGGKKMNAYLKMPSPTYYILKKEIEMCLFEERKQPRCEIRTYWIDEDQDEIEIVNQCDYEIFMAKRSIRQHLQVAPVGMEAEEQSKVDAAIADAADASKTPVTSTESSTAEQAKVPPAAGSYDLAVHECVECDACLMAPIMGFRYKCIQCPNYDLCQNCESKHIHSEHMMVRMPTNNCPNVIEAYVTGRTSRRHGKRSKTSCPFVKNGISVVLDDEAETPNAGSGEGNNEQATSSPGMGKEQRHHGRKHHRRHHRNNFFSHLYEMMHDLAEGGGAAAAAHAMGETQTTTKCTSSSSAGPQTTSTTTTTSNTTKNVPIFTTNEENPIAAAAAAAAAHMAAQTAHETAMKAAEIAAKVAHESAVQAAKNISETMTASSSSSAGGEAAPSAPPTQDGEKEKEATKEKVDATTSPHDAETPQPNFVPPVLPSASLESLAQFLDPQYMKTGIQILNNFSDMFSKMSDPMDNVDAAGNNQIFANLRKTSTASSSTKSSSVSSNLNSLGSDKKNASEKFIEKEQEQEQQQAKESNKPESDVSSHDDLGSDSENDSVSESFIKLDAPKKDNEATTSSSTPSVVNSAQTTPPQSLDKSKVMDFDQLSADLKAHIAQEAAKDSEIPKETTSATTDSAVNTNGSTTSAITSTTTASEPVVTTTTSTSTTTATNTTTPNKPEEKRAVPVYHADQRINNAVHAMMSMGFSNEGAWLTQLLENVDGNISLAMDLLGNGYH